MIPLLLLLAAAPGFWDINGAHRDPFKPEGKASVLFFITTDCPISNSYAPEVQRICAEYGPRHIGCTLVYVDPDLTVADVKKHMRDFRYPELPAILDKTQKLAGSTGATITPDAHSHGTDVHVTGVKVLVPEDLEEAFLATLPEILADAYSEEG